MSLQEKYLYRTELAWTGRRNVRLSAEGIPSLAVSAPPEFSGDAGMWTPEHLLTGATASCLMTTFLAIAEISKLAVASFTVKAIAKLEKVPGEGYRFTGITLLPEIEVAGEDIEKAQRILAKAGKNCFISNSLKTVVLVEAKFHATQPAMAG